ncbi:unnamed protein product [Phytophthora fragariaefolia]|uniref:Unnamed protein product n=1 Tax=Phytophthora fragariaefolia TaxID=1490495 RepID=A0A9W6U4S3_9STRA|nr:unnamed protein product [Phytophthora fragariaefolia]
MVRKQVCELSRFLGGFQVSDGTRPVWVAGHFSRKGKLYLDRCYTTQNNLTASSLMNVIKVHYQRSSQTDTASLKACLTHPNFELASSPDLASEEEATTLPERPIGARVEVGVIGGDESRRGGSREYDSEAGHDGGGADLNYDGGTADEDQEDSGDSDHGGEDYDGGAADEDREDSGDSDHGGEDYDGGAADEDQEDSGDSDHGGEDYDGGAADEGEEDSGDSDHGGEDYDGGAADEGEEESGGDDHSGEYYDGGGADHGDDSNHSGDEHNGSDHGGDGNQSGDEHSGDDIQTDASQLEAVVNLHLLSEASGLESEAEVDDKEEEEPDPPTQTLRPRTRVKYDVKFISVDEDEDDYEGFDSDESEGEDVGEDEDELGRADVDEDGDVLSESDAVDMDEACIDSLMVLPSTMVAFQWWDRKPVHYLCTGAAMTESSIGRKVKQVGAITVQCPAAVTDYQNGMAGVDIHDQLRLQRFSLQTSTTFLKYYKSLFLGFVDMAMVNAYLSHKEAARMAGMPAMARGGWFCLLQNQLLQLKDHDFDGVVATPLLTGQKRRRAPVSHTHTPEQNEDWVTVTGVQKLRQRSCKVCALLRTDSSKKSYATTYFCERCSLDDVKMWLCNKIRREFKGVAKTCFEIWHDDFDAGEAIPPTLGKRVVLRRPGQEAGARKKTRQDPP